MTAASDLVTVVVPAHDAARTIGETLVSARAQTHRCLEILVVDDGSRDSTTEIVGRHAAEDSRIRLIRQANAGVAAARNRGIEEARGGIIAPLDADDLWHREKIARHLAALRAGGPRTALSYDWYAAIDAQSRILAANRRPAVQGCVLKAMCRGNLPGNGSSAVMRRDAVLEVGGYDASLRARGAQGCEDWMLHLLIAERYDFALVPEVLTGYRMVMESMSGDVLQMLRSYDLVMERVRSTHPEFVGELRAGRREQLRWLLARAATGGKLHEAAQLLRELAGHDPVYAAGTTALLPVMVARRLVRSVLPSLRTRRRARFPIGEPPRLTAERLKA